MITPCAVSQELLSLALGHCEPTGRSASLLRGCLRRLDTRRRIRNRVLARGQRGVSPLGAAFGLSMDRDLGDGMHIVGNVLQFFGARSAEFVALGLIFFFSWRKGKTLSPAHRDLLLRGCAFLHRGRGSRVCPIPVTNGDLSLFNVGRPGGWADRAAVGWDILILVFLIVVPNMLRRRVPWGSPGPAVQALLTTWFALFAAAATIGLVGTLHFVEGGQLAKMRPTLVIAATVGAVSLILPLYALLVRACWQHGYGLGFFQPPQWWKDQKMAWNVVWKAIRTKGDAAGSSQPADPDYLGGLLAALMLRHSSQPIPPPMLARIRQVTRLDAATSIGPDEAPAAPLDKLLTELSEKVQLNAPAANADPTGSAA